MVMEQKCPGPERAPEPRPETFQCPWCGEEMEMWTDEKKGRFPGCGVTFARDALEKGGSANSV